jgi:hypothetical protein
VNLANALNYNKACMTNPSILKVGTLGVWQMQAPAVVQQQSISPEGSRWRQDFHSLPTHVLFEGLDFGFPFCHTGPRGNNPNSLPYRRPTGIGSNVADPDVNKNQNAVKCNGTLTLTVCVWQGYARC